MSTTLNSQDLPPKAPNFSPSIIDRAPTSVTSDTENSSEKAAQLLELAAKLSEELNATKSELAKWKTFGEVEAVKAGLIKPYATNLFRFMCVYTSFVGLILMLRGFKAGGFDIQENVLIVLTGSTALAVIGLVKIVVSGIFNTKK